jgi:hypothetical protein
MLFMVIERFRTVEGGRPQAVADRFASRGRLIPEDSGARYVASWMTADGRAGYQLMEAPSRDALDGWIAQWIDLVDFEVTPVLASADFWIDHRKMT